MHGGVVQLETHVESAWIQHLKLKHDKLLLSVPFDLNWEAPLHHGVRDHVHGKARYRLTVCP